MRFSFAALCLVSVLLALPATAQTQGTILGGNYCPTKLACNAADPAFPAPAQLIAIASSCIAKHVAGANSSIAFDASAGLDNTGCLTSNPDAFPTSTGGHIVPHCCIMEAPSGGCAFYCSMVNQQ